jgi:hypothetical protein
MIAQSQQAPFRLAYFLNLFYGLTVSNILRILLANPSQWYFNNLVKTSYHKTPYRCPYRLSLSSQSSRSCAGPNIKVLKDKGLEFANSIRRVSGTSLFRIAGCNYRYINQLYEQSHKLVTFIKVSHLQDWRVKETYWRIGHLTGLRLEHGFPKAGINDKICSIFTQPALSEDSSPHTLSV